MNQTNRKRLSFTWTSSANDSTMDSFRPARSHKCCLCLEFAIFKDTGEGDRVVLDDPLRREAYVVGYPEKYDSSTIGLSSKFSATVAPTTPGRSQGKTFRPEYCATPRTAAQANLQVRRRAVPSP